MEEGVAVMTALAGSIGVLRIHVVEEGFLCEK